MSQMPRQAALPTCPSCAEPLDAGDRFCGACGRDLSAAPARPGDSPTLTMNGAEPAGPAGPGPGSPGTGPAAPGFPASAAPLPAAGAAGAPNARAGFGGTPAPAAAPGGSPAQGAAFGAAPVPGSGSGGASLPGSGGAGAPAPGAQAGGAPPTGAELRGLTAWTSGAGGTPFPGTDMSGAPAPTPGSGSGGTPYPGTGVSGVPAPALGSGSGGTPSPGAGGSGGPVSPGVPSAAAHVPPGDSVSAGGGSVPPGGGTPVPPGAPTPPPPPGAPGAPASGVRFDRPAEPEEYPLQAPDPRVAAEAAAVTETGKVCVACRAGRVDDDGYCENCGHAQPRERDHMEQESGPVAAVSDRGLRHHRNEDAFGIGHTALPDASPALVAIVCDGVSSATRPDDASLAASRAASRSLLTALPQGTHPQQAMHDAIVAASHAVNALAEEPATAREHAPHQNAPACTLVGAVVTAGLLVVGWVGDSRAYWVPTDRSSPPARLTEDDSWAAQMVAAGLMSEAEAYADDRAHAITGWLGADAYELEPHTATFKPDRAGVVVVCTDGLWNYAEGAEEMAGALPLDAAVRPLHSARVLVGHALDGGGHDNVTVAVVPFPAPAQGAGSV